MDWMKILLYVIEAILKGMSEIDAMGMAATYFGVDLNEVRDRFY